MADIKTRDAVKGTIKTIDKAAIASERMKSAYAKTKEKRSRDTMRRKTLPPSMRQIKSPIPQTV